jgi:uncharacterized membrane protein required for colicin V production
MLEAGRVLDGMIIAFLLLQTFLGWRRGLLWQAAGVASLAFGVILGWVLAPVMAEYLTEHVTSNLFRAKLIAFLFILGSVGLMLRLAAAWAEVRSEKNLPKNERELRRAEDRVLGGIFGALKGSVLCLVLIAAIVSLYPNNRMWSRSALATPFAVAGSRLLPDGAVKEVKRWATQSAVDIQKGLDIR